MQAVNIEHLRELARKRLPKAIFEFMDGGAQDELSLRANRTDFQRVKLLPRVLRDVSHRDQSVSIFGEAAASPLIIAPTGLPGLLWPRAEIAEARAAQAAGIPYCLSMMASGAIEDLAPHTRRPAWFQMYLLKDKSVNRSLLKRAQQAGCRVLVLTVDTKAQGPRERDLRNGFTVPPRITLRNLLDVARRPGWLRNVAMGPRITFANLARELNATDDIITIAKFAIEQYDASTDWSALEWCKSEWNGPVVLKGILTAEQARLAVAHGADGIIVSNHGGRQLDGAPSSVAALPAVVEAVAGRCEVILDGGIRRGTDVLKALALGAQACMTGRPFLYGLAAAGEPGVARAIEILKTEIDVGLALLGRAHVRELDRSAIASI